MDELLDLLGPLAKEPNGWAIIVALVIYHQWSKSSDRAEIRKLKAQLSAIARHLGVIIESGPHLIVEDENRPARRPRTRQDRQTPPAA